MSSRYSLWLSALLAGSVVALVWSTRKRGSMSGVPSEDEWVRVSDGRGEWLVAPNYIAPVGIGEAAQIAQAYGAELPSKELVDAIWRAADLKLAPSPRGPSSSPPSDYTARTMNSPEAHADQLAIIDRQILAQSPNRDYRLLAGSHKDVVMQNGVLGIYGWHQLNGKVIQGFYPNHSPDWKDYSQGLRLVKRVSTT